MNHQSELTLSADEKEMMRLYIVDGLTVKEIAVKLIATERAIEKRIETLRRRIGCSNVRQLIFVLTNSNLFESKILYKKETELISKIEAATMLDVSVDTIQRMIVKKVIRSVKIGKKRKVLLIDVQLQKETV